MIGLIEKVVVDCLLQIGGDELRRDVFFAAGIPEDRVYRIDQHYPDTETQRLLGAVLTVTKLSQQELFDVFSPAFFDVVSAVFPQFMQMCHTSEDLVRKQAKIHALIAAGSRAPGESEKTTDKFHVDDHGPHRIVVRYRSELQLCGLYRTLVQEAARRFGDTVHVIEKGCAHHGADHCTMVVQWSALAGQPTDLDRRLAPLEGVA